MYSPKFVYDDSPQPRRDGRTKMLRLGKMAESQLRMEIELFLTGVGMLLGILDVHLRPRVDHREVPSIKTSIISELCGAFPGAGALPFT